MKKAIVFAAAFAAGSALAQVGSFNGGSISDMGAGGRFGAGPQIDPRDAPATGQAAAAARTSAGAGAAGALDPNSASASAGSNTAPRASGATPVVSGTTWGAAQPGLQMDGGQVGDKP
jgi:hypothetical protein